MADIVKEPIAFFSYVQNDDKHESGKISLLRQRLEGELRMLTGKPFKIFQDRNDIDWGQQWEGRINETIDDVIFLIPIVTPTYFESRACRSEYMKFLLRERSLGEDRLIFPIYYVSCDSITNEILRKDDEIAQSISSRQWTDWRPLRFKNLDSNEVNETIFAMATAIKKSMSELASVIEAARRPDLVRSRQATKAATTKAKPDLTKLPPHDNVHVSARPPAVISETTVPFLVGKGITIDGQKALKEDSYYAYTKIYDEVIAPSSLADADEIVKLGNLVKPLVNSLRKSISRRIGELNTYLSSMKDWSVTLLIDNSGSMRGAKVFHCAAWSVVVTEVFAQAGLPLEILGYTTRAWKGGLSRELWLHDGKQANPGRLNDLRHLVYKSFAQSQTDAAANLYLMCRQGLLKENIDGEALLWSYGRAKSFKSRKHLVLVISDGAPVDDSTLSVNAGNYLEKHLRSAVAYVMLDTNTKLYGIGLEYEVDRYFPASKKVLDFNLLGDAIFDAIISQTSNGPAEKS